MVWKKYEKSYYIRSASKPNHLQKNPVISFCSDFITQSYLDRLGSIKRRTEFINDSISKHLGLLMGDKFVILKLNRLLNKSYENYKYARGIIRAINKGKKIKYFNNEFRGENKIYNFRLDCCNTYGFPSKRKSDFIRKSILLEIDDKFAIRYLIKNNFILSKYIIRCVGCRRANRKNNKNLHLKKLGFEL